MNQDLEQFLQKIQDLHGKDKRELLGLFAYFLTRAQNQTYFKPSQLSQCFEESAIPGPANIYVDISRSGLFVKTKGGWQLRRDARQRIAEMLATANGATSAAHGSSSSLKTENPQEVLEHLAEVYPNPFAGISAPNIRKNVFVVHGRDKKLNGSMFNFLRSLGLTPIEWSEAVKATGETFPTNLQIVQAGFAIAQAVLVLFTPDEISVLRDDLCQNSSERSSNFQSRPNVYFEAGLAISQFPKRTLVVEVGSVREVSDLSGKNSIRVDSNPEWRHALAERLRTAGCDVKQTGTQWLSTGDFTVNGLRPKRR